MYFKKIYIIIVSLFIFLVASNSISIIHAREIDSKFMDFLLSGQNISGYDIEHQGQMGWQISPDELGDCVSQQWYNDNGISQTLTLRIGIFDSEEEAIRGMLYYTGTTAEPWIWGPVISLCCRHL